MFNTVLAKPSNRAALVLIAQAIEERVKRNYPIPTVRHAIPVKEEEVYRNQCAFATSVVARVKG
jgi:hypothetical protein